MRWGIHEAELVCGGLLLLVAVVEDGFVVRFEGESVLFATGEVYGI